MGQSQSSSNLNPNTSHTINARWEWQSNPNPYSSTEQPQWTPYSPLQNYLIEKAFQNKSKEIDIGDYEIIQKGKDWIQRSNAEKFNQRPVRRIEQDPIKLSQQKANIEEEIRSERFFGAETPKTYNNAFGSQWDFLLFFENRSPEMKGFSGLFKEIEESQNLEWLKKKIVPCLVNSFQLEAAKMTTPRSLEEGDALVKIFIEKTFSTFEEFYGIVLKAYSMEGFLYKNLNKYLRNEDWTQLDTLLPFAFCLCKAFLCGDIILAANYPGDLHLEPNPIRKNFTLYRGAQFDEIALSFYNLKSVTNFSWNAATSTSTNRVIAERFMYSNIDMRKVPVMFIIEVDFSTSEYLLSLIDVKKYSAFPNENEVVLPPGSIFQIISFERDEKGAMIDLKLVTDVAQLSHQGQIMYGAMQADNTLGIVSKIVGLEGSQLLEAIGHLKGNRLLQEIEFNFCHYNEQILQAMIEVLPTISKLKNLTLSSLSVEDKSHWSTIIKALGKLKIVNLRVSERVLNDEDLYRFSAGIKNFKSLTALSLNFAVCNITDVGFGVLCCEGLKSLEILETLILDFENCYQIKGESLTDFSLPSLKKCIVNFAKCGITNKGIQNLSSHAIKNLTSLVTLSLNFEDCYHISDEGLTYLAVEGLKPLSNTLQNLQLKFFKCYQITNPGLISLASQGLKSLKRIVNFDLNFSQCNLMNAAVDGFYDEIKDLEALQDLTLNFSRCNITEKCYQDLQDKIQNSAKKIFFSLNKESSEENEEAPTRKFQYRRGEETYDLFQHRIPMIDEDNVYNLENLEQVKEFYSQIQAGKGAYETLKKLKVTGIRYIKEEPLPEINFEGSKNLKALTHLDLSLYICSKMSDEGLKTVCLKQLAPLRNTLLDLAVNLEDCFNLTAVGLGYLGAEGFKNLSSLQALHLNIAHVNIQPEGIKRLATEGLKYLTELRQLKLNFERCRHVDDEAVGYLSKEGLKYLKNMKDLKINFNGCYRIGNTGVKSLCEGLKGMENLAMLNIHFHSCRLINNEGLEIFCKEGLRHMKKLEVLHLNMEFCKEITDEGLNKLFSLGIKNLTSLVQLALNFEGCTKISKYVYKNVELFVQYFGYQETPNYGFPSYLMRW